METLKDILWPIVVVGGLGAFIDFLIGRTGQEKAKDFLLEWWVRFGDVKPRNLGKQDALFIASVIERWLGSSFWSRRRIISSVIFAIFSVILGTVVSLFWKNYNVHFAHSINIFLLLPTMWLEVLLLCISISLLRILTLNIARLSGDSKLRDALIFCVFSIFYYVMLVLWPIITIAIKHFAMDLAIFSIYSNVQIYLAGVKLVIFDAVKNLHWSMLLPNELVVTILKSYQLSSIEMLNISDNYRLEASIFHFARYNMAVIPGLFRLAVSIVFLTSFLLRPLIMKPTLLMWARIVESDNPTFTLIFALTAAFGVAFKEVAKHI
jgi:hypothetical protein